MEEKYDLTKQIPVNLLKEGPEPEYKPDSEYPAWVLKLADEKPIIEDVVMKGLENVPRDMIKTVFRAVSAAKRGTNRMIGLMAGALRFDNIHKSLYTV